MHKKDWQRRDRKRKEREGESQTKKHIFGDKVRKGLKYRIREERGNDTEIEENEEENTERERER